MKIFIPYFNIPADGATKFRRNPTLLFIFTFWSIAQILVASPASPSRFVVTPGHQGDGFIFVMGEPDDGTLDGEAIGICYSISEKAEVNEIWRTVSSYFEFGELILSSSGRYLVRETSFTRDEAAKFDSIIALQIVVEGTIIHDILVSSLIELNELRFDNFERGEAEILDGPLFNAAKIMFGWEVLQNEGFTDCEDFVDQDSEYLLVRTCDQIFHLYNMDGEQIAESADECVDHPVVQSPF